MNVSADDAVKREVILQAAIAMFSISSFDGASITDIARSCGVSSPLIHYYFKDKEDLWKAAMTFGAGNMMIELRATLDQLKDVDPIVRLKFFIRRYIKLCAERSAIFLIMVHESERPSKRLTWLSRTLLDPFYCLVSKLVTDAQESGKLNASAPVYHLTQIIVGACYSFTASRHRLLLVYGVDPCTPENQERHADLVIEILLNGMSVRKSQGASRA